MRAKPRIVPLGDSAVLVQFGNQIDLTINRRVHALAALIAASPLDGMIGTIPAYGTLLIHYDPLILTYFQASKWIRTKLDQVQDVILKKPRRIEVPVRYGGEYGIDLQFVADSHHLSVEDVIRIHSEKTYTIYMMGFTPGFPYMGKLDDLLVTPRLDSPRTRVPSGTVAIAGSQTGIYPIDSPGGWRLIGYTSLQLFDPKSESPFLFSPGDEVRFVAEK
ncbi:MAG TPA: 5-oxoprolinase subunit PxpB [Anaerolineales bacterium]|jgi:KipI family sensor histidine kinase inhibitor|nr:5-oxoprolinase subunit PxpB [Anaerolineales bacterium]